MLSENKRKPALVCVDWGSSNLRAFLLSAEGVLIDKVANDKGVLGLSKSDFEPVLAELLQPWAELLPLPVLLAGMVGAAQGWLEVPYTSCPVKLESLTKDLCFVKNSLDLTIAIVPGVKCDSMFSQPDVMRGEEVQIFGALLDCESNAEFCDIFSAANSSVFCLPGTHSKWASVIGGDSVSACILSFETYMTGELFGLLKRNSILGKLLETQCENEVVLSAFDRGVAHSRAGGGIMHQMFSARTLVLMKELRPDEISSYLSGLLIGAEIYERTKSDSSIGVVLVIGSEQLNSLYARALSYFSIKNFTLSSDRASLLGVLAIAKQANLVTSEVGV